MVKEYAPEKDPKAEEPYFFVFCSKDGTNDGGTSDYGDLQGDTIASITSVTASPTGELIVGTTNSNAVTIGGISYAVNTVVTAWYSAGNDETEYDLECVILTNDGRTLVKTMIVPVKEQ